MSRCQRINGSTNARPKPRLPVMLLVLAIIIAAHAEPPEGPSDAGSHGWSGNAEVRVANVHVLHTFSGTLVDACSLIMAEWGGMGYPMVWWRLTW